MSGAAETILPLTGRLDAHAAAALWDKTETQARAAAGTLVLDLSGLEYCDTAGARLLLAAEQAHDGPSALRGGDPAWAALVERVRALPGIPPRPAVRGRAGIVGGLVQWSSNGIAFIGEGLVATIRLPARRRMLRIADIWLTADQAGVKAIPLILLLGFLIGLILAFQSAIPLRRFGADIFVPNLVAISLLRELGPLLAAVVLSGRTGSAFAAEIGTMKVNEEIDALSTMGLDPVTMLVLPRLIAAMLVMPALTLAMDIAGLVGMGVVMQAFGFPTVTILNQVASAVKVADLMGGLFKAICFGGVVAAIGCRAGLGIGVGPRALGQSATAAVVGGIVATILIDGVFALAFYRLGL